MAGSYSIGDFQVRADERRLLRDGQAQALGARAFDLLLCLLQHRDRVVGKDELLASVWPGVVVEENNLTVQVSALRKLLGADAIATVAGRGYRFTMAVLPLSAPAANASAPPAVAPALLPAPGTPTNLPAERSSFIGRQREIEALQRALAEHRLVTLTGIGGAGKTRLALHVGALELGRFPDGVFFVDLAPLADPELVPQTLAAACGLTPGDSALGTARSFTDRLVAALAPRRCLLLVDNCEHLLDASAELLDRLLAGCPHLVLLATSREALGVEGERLLQVPSLAVPDATAPDQLTDAMHLFADRAAEVQAAFVLDALSTASVAEICRRLDGIPLAIEFAAARVAHLSVQQIAERLEDRFRLLTGGRRRIQRQQTLAATLDWSHDLLGAHERTVFRRLAVFAGGFALDAAEAVCSDADLPRAAVLDWLGSLAAKSLLTVGAGDAGDTRYRLLETVRLYALDKLAAAGEVAALRSRHRDHHLDWLASVPQEQLMFDLRAIDAVGREVDNLRGAAEWCVASDQPDLLVRLITAMSGYWITGNSYRAARGLLEGALQQQGRLSTQERASSHAVAAWLSAMALDLPAATDHAAQAVELCSDPASPQSVQAHSIRAFGLSVSASMPGADPGLIASARRHAGQAVVLAQAGLAQEWQAHAALFHAYVEMHVGEFEAAARWQAASARSCEHSRHAGWLLPCALAGLAVSSHLLGRDPAALQAAQQFLALELWSDTRWPWLDTWRVEFAPALFAGGERALADGELRRGAARLRRNGVDLAPNQYLSIAAAVECLRGRPDRAGRLLGAARSVGGADLESITFRTPTSLALYRHYLPLVRDVLGAEESRRARDEGRAMTLDEAFEYALSGLDAPMVQVAI